MAFKNYWFETGTPTFLVDLLRERAYPLPAIEDMPAAEPLFGTFELDRLAPEALLFQAGYLTIKNVQGDFSDLYRLGYPNQEVKSSFLEHLLLNFTSHASGDVGSQYKQLGGHLKSGNFDTFFETVNAIFAAIPYTLKTERNEAYFHTLFYLMMSASGVDARSEVLTSRGRIDLVVSFADRVFVIEFKCDRSADEAIRQIRKMGYAERFKGSDKAIFLMGINFSAENRNVTEWRMVPESVEE